MRKIVTLVSLLLLISLVACSNDEEPTDLSPSSVLASYSEAQENGDYAAMYAFLNSKSKASIDQEAFVALYQETYEALGTTAVTIDYTLPDTNTDTEADEATADKAPVTATLSVSQDTRAGPYQFEQTLEMIPIINDENIITDWVLNWHQGHVIPPIREGGEIEVITTEPQRGEILDRHQEALAMNGELLQIGVDIGNFTDRTTEIEALSVALDLSVETIEAKLDQSWVEEGLFIPLKAIPAHDEATREALRKIPAVLSQTIAGRIYPYGEAAAHLVGYVGTVTAEDLENDASDTLEETDIIGKRGLEQRYEDTLRGEPGFRLVVNREGTKTGITEVAPKNGEDLTLTIDIDTQMKIFESMQGEAGHAAAIDPKTGETLALVSSPAFDPHLFTYGISNRDYSRLVDDPLNPLFNRFSSTYAPGSSFKPLTAMIGLHAGTFTPEDGLTIEGLTYQEPSFGNYEVRRVSESDGPVDLHDALVRSDNIYFARRALEIGADAFVEGLALFGFNQEDFDFAYPIQRAQIANETLSGDVLLADSGYGQGQLLMSSLHLASSYTPIINQGHLIKPILFTEEEKGQIYTESLITSSDANKLKQALYDTVHSENGTATVAQSDAVTILGKTGTAELKSSATDTNQAENGWFVGFNQEETHLISMMIEGVNGRGGSSYTAERVKAAFLALQP